MSRLDENLGAVGFDNLINGTYPPAEVFSVKVRAGIGVLKRGTVLAGSQGQALAPIADEPDLRDMASAVLAETVDTGESGVEDVTAIAYRTGHFNANRLIVSENYNNGQLSAADKENLRSMGILISDAVEI